MSTISSGARYSVAGMFRAAYRWLTEEEKPAPPPSAPPPQAGPSLPPPVPPTKPPAPAPPKPQPAVGSDTLELPLQSILDTLPPELRAKVRQPQVGLQTIQIPLAQVMPQLAQGSVRISFAALRRAAPHVFALDTNFDRVLVMLPLNEILPRIDPARFVRRNDQKQVELSAEIASPFGPQGEGLVFSAGPARPPAATAPRASAPAPSSAALPAPVSGSVAAARPISAPPRPAAAAPAVPRPPAVPTAPPPRPAAHAFATPLSAPPRAMARDTEVVRAPARQPAASTERLQIPLRLLLQAWPQAVRQEVIQMNLLDAKVAFPVDVLARALKQGRVGFPWRLVRAWIQPAVPPTVSAHDATPLELPLQVVAPLFVGRKSGGPKERQKVVVDESIPNLFFGFPQPDAGPGISHSSPVAAPAAVQPPDTNYYVWDDTSDTVHLDAAEVKPAPTPTPSPATEFATRYATPNEIVSRAAALDGVAGALAALPDGLMVASRLAPELNGDTLAAFLPHIFGRVSQCTKELRMGELNNLNFTVGNVPWKIFRVNAIFFAAFGRAGEPLPTGQLAALAAELDRRPRTS